MIELVVVLAIFGFTLAAVLPEVGAWMRSLSVRNSGEAIRSGVERARMEALRRNANVTFWLVSDSSKTLSSSCALSTSGPSWVVSGADPSGKCDVAPSATVDPRLVDRWSAADGGINVQVAGANGAGVAANSVTFNSVGQVLSSGSQLARVEISHSVPGVRGLRVQIDPGGSTRLCDPNVPAGDPRKC
jgi:type IV fimbrial biogenesis protein FimT